MLPLFCIIFVLLLVFLIIRKLPFAIKSHWQHFYDGIHISTPDFFAQIKAGLEERKIEGLDFDEESFLETHILSARRIYLRISKFEYVFYISAVPFGTGTFVSSWMCIKDENIFNRIPFLSKAMGKDRNNKTFYQMDTESMYQSAIHSVVVATADKLTAEQGQRGLSELEKQIQGNK